mgnify:FL=1
MRSFISTVVLAMVTLSGQDTSKTFYVLPSVSVDAAGDTFSVVGSLGEWVSQISSSIRYDLDSGFWGSMTERVLGIEEETILPVQFSIVSAYPNPFNPAISIGMEIPKLSDVTFSVYDIRGRKVFSLLRKGISPGRYDFLWRGVDNSGRHLPSGVYFFMISDSHISQSIKITLLK